MLNGKHINSVKTTGFILFHPEFILIFAFKLKNMSSIKPRIHKLLDALNEGVFEKEHHSPSFVIGGHCRRKYFSVRSSGSSQEFSSAKAEICIQRKQCIRIPDVTFQYPMRFSGRYRSRNLKMKIPMNDYRRVSSYSISGFLDEIWKAGPAIQNSPLTVINERYTERTVYSESSVESADSGF